jgi:hypothetical protein
MAKKIWLERCGHDLEPLLFRTRVVIQILIPKTSIQIQQVIAAAIWMDVFLN